MKFTIYTDGGCSGNKRDANCDGAFGYVILNDFGFPFMERATKVENTTNNRMELSAVLSGLKDLLNHHLNDEKEPSASNPKDVDVVIISDSKYVVDNYNDYLQEWKKRGWRKLDGAALLNSDLWMEIDKCTPEYKSVTFKWVRGHNGDHYNDRVDMTIQQILHKRS